MRIAFLTILLAVCLSPLASSLQPKSRLVRTSAAVTVNVKKASPLLFAGAAMSDKGEEWTKPRLHNTATFRSLAILGALTAAGVSSKSPLAMLSVQTKAALHLFSYATWFGTMVYTTFVLGITMFKNLPRTTFGKLQAKLFPKYFALSSIAIVLQVSPSSRRQTCEVADGLLGAADSR